jgi:hypothetical protein
MALARAIQLMVNQGFDQRGTVLIEIVHKAFSGSKALFWR